MPQKLLLFPSKKPKKFELQKHKDNDILVLNVSTIATRPKNSNC